MASALNTTGTTSVLFDTATCSLPPFTSHCTYQLFTMFPGDVASSNTADINKKTSVYFLVSEMFVIFVSEANVRLIGTDLLSSTV